MKSKNAMIETGVQ